VHASAEARSLATHSAHSTSAASAARPAAILRDGARADADCRGEREQAACGPNTQPSRSKGSWCGHAALRFANGNETRNDVVNGERKRVDNPVVERTVGERTAGERHDRMGTLAVGHERGHDRGAPGR
jgi:hypothetical protein